MPFTASHAVVALPFIRMPLVPAAIAVGAMTPDLPLFVRGIGLDYGHTHDVAWIPLTTAVALLLLLLWRLLLRPAARELTPSSVATRLPSEWDGGPVTALCETFGIVGARSRVSGTRLLLLVVSLAFGVATHIAWDLFTHEGRWGSEAFPVLDDMWGPLPGYRWLQHGSSVLGLVIIAGWAVLWLRRRDAVRITRVLPGVVRVSWWLSLPVILMVAWVWGLVRFGPLISDTTVTSLAYQMLLPACALWGALTLLLCLAVIVLQARSRRI